MWFNLVFLTVIFWVSGFTTAQSFPVATTKIFNFANPDDSERLFYTKLSEISVFEDYGYLAPFPGYCGSDQIELIEFYSPVLEVFRYDTSNNIYNYLSDYKNKFRPVRVLGYAYYSTPSVWLSGNAPFIKQGLQSPFYVRYQLHSSLNTLLQKAISVRFEMVRVLTKNGKTSFAVSPQLVQTMVSEGWTLTDEIRPGPLSSQNEVEKIRELCGEMERCQETFDNTTGLYRPINPDKQYLGGKTVVEDCGYFLSNAVACFQQATEMFSYIPSYDGNQVIYGNYNEGTGNNSVGYASPHIFSLLKL
ncbi:hypothetical protein CRE_08736 [Caenorhabditis remanei]|uniref:Uncharacterized protein n=1 Tax=Caenorhabditis remanei TaxID=31234 RepID=E3LH86_CAERE|nr:hypothetical protein CRE_08736 [Caenorhabditis remanei]